MNEERDELPLKSLDINALFLSLALYVLANLFQQAMVSLSGS